MLHREGHLAYILLQPLIITLDLIRDAHQKLRVRLLGGGSIRCLALCAPFIRAFACWNILDPTGKRKSPSQCYDLALIGLGIEAGVHLVLLYDGRVVVIGN